MPRIALLALVVVVVALAVIALLPERDRRVPPSTITLSDADVALYPEADPSAIWTFRAPEVEYDPDTRETTLLHLSDGRRSVDGATDFTLASDRIVIDNQDDLRGERIQAHLIQEDADLDMVSKGGREVLIDQRSGRFEVPRVTLSSPEGRSVFEDMKISFDLTEFEAGGPGTVGYGEFKVASPGAKEQP